MSKQRSWENFHKRQEINLKSILEEFQRGNLIYQIYLILLNFFLSPILIRNNILIHRMKLCSIFHTHIHTKDTTFNLLVVWRKCYMYTCWGWEEKRKKKLYLRTHFLTGHHKPILFTSLFNLFVTDWVLAWKTWQQ